MATQVIDVINDVQILLNDFPLGYGQNDGDRWKFVELLSYLNLAQKDVVVKSWVTKAIPANVVTKVLKLGAGSTQNAAVADSSVIGVLNILRNIGNPWISGTTYALGDIVYSEGVRYSAVAPITTSIIAPVTDTVNWSPTVSIKYNEIEQINDANLASLIENYRGEANNGANSQVLYWAPDNVSRTIFSIYPPQPNREDTETSFQYVEAIVVAMPTMAVADGNITLSDIYKDAIMDYMLYRAFLRDADSEEGLARAQAHMLAYVSNSVFSL